MNDNRLDERLDSLRNKPLPICPANFETDVLRRIRLQKERDADIWSWIDSLLPKVSLAAALLVVAILASALVTIAATSLQASVKRVSASYALGFDTLTHPQKFDLDAN